MLSAKRSASLYCFWRTGNLIAQKTLHTGLDYLFLFTCFCMKVLFAAPYLNILLHEQTKVLETEWLDFANSQQLRASLTEALQLGRRHRVRGWIGNNARMRTIRPTDQDWMNLEWFPEFTKLAVKRLAVVVSNDALNQMGIDNILTRASAHVPFDTRYFAGIEEARSWAGDNS